MRCRLQRNRSGKQQRHAGSPGSGDNRHRLWNSGICASRKCRTVSADGTYTSFIVASSDTDFSCVTVCDPVLDLPFAGSPRTGEPSPPAPNRRTAAVHSKTPETDSDGSLLVGLVVPHLKRLVWGASHRETRNGDGLASRRFSPFRTRKVRRGQPGRPLTSREVRGLIRLCSAKTSSASQMHECQCKMSFSYSPRSEQSG